MYPGKERTQLTRERPQAAGQRKDKNPRALRRLTVSPESRTEIARKAPAYLNVRTIGQAEQIVAASGST
jgi:hypothetical protein